MNLEEHETKQVPQMTKPKDTLFKDLSIFKRILPILPFVASFFILYYLYPASFESTWKGRTFYLFFLWLVFLETILNWEELATKKWKLKSVKTVLMSITCALPIAYVIVANFFGLNKIIIDLSVKYNVGGPYDITYFANLMPLSIEYLVFTILFALMLLTTYETSYLGKYAISTFFLGLIGFIYIADNLYPNGKWPPLQFPVFPTTILASSTLNFLGFQTSIRIIGTSSRFGWMPYLSAWDPNNPFIIVGFGIGWPCAGIESLLIYTVTILLFLTKSNIKLKHRIIYFVIGAAATYFINILRIVTIFILAINYGQNSSEVWRFHDYYGQLYSMIWIIMYPLIIIGISSLWIRIKSSKAILKPTPSPM